MEQEPQTGFHEKWATTIQKLQGVEIAKVRGGGGGAHCTCTYCKCLVPIPATSLHFPVCTSIVTVVPFSTVQAWLCWLIFIIKIGCAPLNLIFGAMFECTAEPRLPLLMMAAGALEVRARATYSCAGCHNFWVCLGIFCFFKMCLGSV